MTLIDNLRALTAGIQDTTRALNAMADALDGRTVRMLIEPDAATLEQAIADLYRRRQAPTLERQQRRRLT
jgi:hypothetical protein